ncbi:hypothetical protein N5K27_22445 [Pigmentiphaga sp. GD03639]|uniref:hypothetical protein n=1 Tax=Pigmentiphaga sp. GD03639 TaxID=2975354 RepID=UPI00244B5836|nr:hypothetical protein [Pigmentiphaga sp. GD03639]MDH2239072.1 hypothetical protein [Pigmentiphaga sp. GD03639]
MIEITIEPGQYLRRDLCVFSGTDDGLALSLFVEADDDTESIPGDLSLIIWRGAYDHRTISASGNNPAIFAIAAGDTRNLIGRWYWRIEQTMDDKLARLCGGVLDIRNPDGGL